MSRKVNQQGLTLVEVLISIALMGMIAISILGLFSTSLRNNMASKEVISDAVMSKDIMERLKDELTLMPSEERELDKLVAKLNTIQGDYENTTITIEPRDEDKNLYTIKIQMPGVREGSVENLVSQIYLP